MNEFRSGSGSAAIFDMVFGAYRPRFIAERCLRTASASARPFACVIPDAAAVLLRAQAVSEHAGTPRSYGSIMAVLAWVLVLAAVTIIAFGRIKALRAPAGQAKHTAA
jgi:hypothetical protein